MNILRFIFCGSFPFFLYSSNSPLQHFNNNADFISLAQLQVQYPHLAHLNAHQNSTNHDAEFVRPKTDSMINLATACYVLFELYKAYEKLYISTEPITENTDSSIAQMAKSAVLYCCPQFLISFGTHSQFLIHALTITLTALFYKTIAKLIVFSIQGDLLDLVMIASSRLLKILKSVVL